MYEYLFIILFIVHFFLFVRTFLPGEFLAGDGSCILESLEGFLESVPDDSVIFIEVVSGQRFLLEPVLLHIVKLAGAVEFVSLIAGKFLAGGTAVAGVPHVN